MGGTLAAAKLIATARRDRAPLGSLPDDVVSRDHSGVALRHDDFVSVGVECEIAVRLGRDLKPIGRAVHRGYRRAADRGLSMSVALPFHEMATPM
jgi:hypothetical protein